MTPKNVVLLLAAISAFCFCLELAAAAASGSSLPSEKQSVPSGLAAPGVQQDSLKHPSGANIQSVEQGQTQTQADATIAKEQIPESFETAELLRAKGVLQWSSKEGVISEDQERRVFSRFRDVLWEFEKKNGQPNAAMRILTTVHSQLTLLNVLYFGSAVLVMFSFTLFATMALQAWGPAGLLVIGLFLFSVFAGVGINIWNNHPEFRTVGGLLCTCAVCMVPVTVYGFQWMVNWWAGQPAPGAFCSVNVLINSGWLVLEAATIVAGLVFVFIVPFPFILSPVAFALWFMSMDIVPAVFSQRWPSFEDRRNISIAFGTVMVCVAFVTEMLIGSEPDFSFWLYLFGFLTWLPAINMVNSPIVKLVIFELYVTLIIMAPVLDRQMFHVVGSIGLVVYTFGFPRDINNVGSMFEGWDVSLFTHFVRALLVTALLFAGAKRADDSVVLLAALLSFVVTNLESSPYIGSQLFVLAQFVVNLSYVVIARQFAGQSMNLYFMTVPAQAVFSAVSCAGVCMIHASYVVNVMSNNISTGINFSWVLHLVTSISLCLLAIPLEQYMLVWVGLAGLGVLTFIPVSKSATIACELPELFFIVALAILTLSRFFDSLIGYWLGLYLCSNLLTFSIRNRGVHGLVIALAMVLLSSGFESKGMAALGGFYLFVWVHAKIFHRSPLTPFYLTGIGLSIMYSASKYQANIEQVQATVLSYIPAEVVSLWQMRAADLADLNMLNTHLPKISLDSLPLAAKVAFLPTVIFTEAQKIPPLTAAFILLGLVAVRCQFYLIQVLVNKLGLFRTQPPAARVVWFNFALAHNQTAPGHGVILRVRGEKPANLTATQIKVNVQGDGFWDIVRQRVPGALVTMVRMSFLPMKLCPTMVDARTALCAGKSTFDMTVTLGAGNGYRISHQTIQNQLRSLADGGNAEMTLVFSYSQGWFSWSKPLFELTTKASEIRRLIEDMEDNKDKQPGDGEPQPQQPEPQAAAEQEQAAKDAKAGERKENKKSEKGGCEVDEPGQVKGEEKAAGLENAKKED